MPLDHTDKVDREGNLGSEQTGVSINLAKFCVTGGSRLVPSRLRDAHCGSRVWWERKKGDGFLLPITPWALLGSDSISSSIHAFSKVCGGSHTTCREFWLRRQPICFSSSHKV